MSLKKIQSRLLVWESAENPLAPLTPLQREAILDLESLLLDENKNNVRNIYKH